MVTKDLDVYERGEGGRGNRGPLFQQKDLIYAIRLMDPKLTQIIDYRREDSQQEILHRKAKSGALERSREHNFLKRFKHTSSPT